MYFIVKKIPHSILLVLFPIILSSVASRKLSGCRNLSIFDWCHWFSQYSFEIHRTNYDCPNPLFELCFPRPSMRQICFRSLGHCNVVSINMIFFAHCISMHMWIIKKYTCSLYKFLQSSVYRKLYRQTMWNWFWTAQKAKYHFQTIK